jgi:uncharacterized membrane protein
MTPDPASGARGRTAAWPGFDFIKFLCILFMVLVHSFYWLATTYGLMRLDPTDFAYRVIPFAMLVGVFPLMLPFTAGCVFRLTLAAGPALPPLPWERVRSIAVSCAAVAFLGFCMNFLCSGITVFFAWNVLQTAGLAIVVIALLVRRGRIWPVAVAAAAALVLATPLRDWVSLGTGSPYALKVLLGDPTGYHVWPFLPWFPTVAAGFGLAHAYLGRSSDARFFWGSLLAGALLVGWAGLSGELIPAYDHYDLVGAAIFIARPAFVAGVVGISLCLTAFATRCFAGRPFAPRGIVICFGRGILWIYLIHMVVGVWIDRLLLFRLDKAAVLRHPLVPVHLAALVGLPVALVLLSWGVGWAAVRLLGGKRLRITLRKVA